MKKLGTLIMIALCMAIATPAALAMSAGASITINIVAPTPPTLTNNNPGPDVTEYYVEETIIMTATADDATSYIWYKNGTVIPDETGATLTIASATGNDGGVYTAVAVNECGDESGPSAPLDLTVYDRVEVTIAADPEAVEGEGEYASCTEITLTANVFGIVKGPLTYQWLMGETPIQGATNATFLIAPATSGQSGNYSVVVTDDMGRDPMTP